MRPHVEDELSALAAVKEINGSIFCYAPIEISRDGPGEDRIHLRSVEVEVGQHLLGQHFVVAGRKGVEAHFGVKLQAGVQLALALEEADDAVSGGIGVGVLQADAAAATARATAPRGEGVKPV